MEQSAWHMVRVEFMWDITSYFYKRTALDSLECSVWVSRYICWCEETRWFWHWERPPVIFNPVPISEHLKTTYAVTVAVWRWCHPIYLFTFVGIWPEQFHFHFSLSCIGEGNGNPLQCSCLGNPRDGGAWWAAVYGVAQSRTRLKWLSSSSSSRQCWGVKDDTCVQETIWMK